MNNLYVRFRGRVFGPISLERAAELAKRGQISRQHEISFDKVSWKPAAQVAELFPIRSAQMCESDSEGAVESKNKSNSDAATRVIAWYANFDGTQQGPASEDDVKQWIDMGKVNRTTLVWREGLVNWVEAGVTQPHWFAGRPPEPDVSFIAPLQPNRRHEGPLATGREVYTNERVPNYMISAILSTLFCCLPLGIVSLVYAFKVNSLLAEGDIVGAKRASSYAKLWAQLSVWLILGPALLILLGFLIWQLFIANS